jgi:hypothetical protein
MTPLTFLLGMTQVSRMITSIDGTFVKNAAMAGICFVGCRMLLFLLMAVLQRMINQLLKLP